MPASNWPKGVPNRIRRPDSSTGVALIGAMIGGFLGGPPGVAVGGGLGAAFGAKPSLFQALRDFLSENDMRLVSIRRYGPRVALAVFETNGVFDSVRSQAPTKLKGEDLEDWLYGDLIHQINASARTH